MSEIELPSAIRRKQSYAYKKEQLDKRLEDVLQAISNAKYQYRVDYPFRNELDYPFLLLIEHLKNKFNKTLLNQIKGYPKVVSYDACINSSKDKGYCLDISHHNLITDDIKYAFISMEDIRYTCKRFVFEVRDKPIISFTPHELLVLEGVDIPVFKEGKKLTDIYTYYQEHEHELSKIPHIRDIGDFLYTCETREYSCYHKALSVLTSALPRYAECYCELYPY